MHISVTKRRTANAVLKLAMPLGAKLKKGSVTVFRFACRLLRGPPIGGLITSCPLSVCLSVRPSVRPSCSGTSVENGMTYSRIKLKIGRKEGPDTCEWLTDATFRSKGQRSRSPGRLMITYMINIRLTSMNHHSVENSTHMSGRPYCCLPAELSKHHGNQVGIPQPKSFVLQTLHSLRNNKYKSLLLT